MNASVSPWALLDRVGHWSATLRLLVGLAAGAAAWLLLPRGFGHLSHLVATWDGFSIATLLLLWTAIFTADTDRIRKVAASEDLSRTVSFFFVLIAASASLLGVIALLRTTHTLAPDILAWHIGLSIVAVGAAKISAREEMSMSSQ